MKLKRRIIEIDEERCDGCGQCIPACAEGAIQVVDGKARLVSEKYCDGLGACLGECPNNALNIIEREAEEFDEEAVEEYLQARVQTESPAEATMVCGCPSAQIQSLVPKASSALSHWPVQIRLVPPTAQFLKGADLLVAADCTPVAYASFHQDFLKGKVVMLGCPKFDEPQAYIQRFAEIFSKLDIKSITVVVMEVPCCQGLSIIIKKAMDIAAKEIPTEKVVIGTRGEVLKRQKLAA